jgi:hypothetical protein
MESSDKSLDQHRNEASEILKDILNSGDNFKPAKQTIEVRQLFIGNVINQEVAIAILYD